MTVLCIIQARMGSTRLPEKVLRPILSKPMLWWVVYRTQQARYADSVVIATTTHPEDNAIVDLCERENWQYYRGSSDDLLDRYYQSAKQFNADYIVRITSDCPLIDPLIVDHVITTYLSVAPPVDYISNRMPHTYPRGLDVEIFSLNILEKVWLEDKKMAWREHVTPYIYQNPDIFTLQNVMNPVDYSSHRWTVDTPEDMELVQKIYAHFGHGDFSWQDVLDLLTQHPDWVKINAHIQQKIL